MSKTARKFRWRQNWIHSVRFVPRGACCQEPGNSQNERSRRFQDCFTISNERHQIRNVLDNMRGNYPIVTITISNHLGHWPAIADIINSFDLDTSWPAYVYFFRRPSASDNLNLDIKIGGFWRQRIMRGPDLRTETST
jgi:hypothetical protein